MAAELELLADVENQLKILVGTLKKDCPSPDNEINTTLKVFALVKLFCEISLCLVVPVERMRHVKSHLMKIMKKKKERANVVSIGVDAHLLCHCLFFIGHVFLWCF